MDKFDVFNRVLNALILAVIAAHIIMILLFVWDAVKVAML